MLYGRNDSTKTANYRLMEAMASSSLRFYRSFILVLVNRKTHPQIMKSGKEKTRSIIGTLTLFSALSVMYTVNVDSARI